MSSGNGGQTNRLAGETSPYLLQHRHNPVDWYPWGEEALERARREDRPIFLSIGYAACHWCHVMERESFENEAVAKVVNENFVPVKVDREERPDLDEIYMTATQMLTGHGGWPMSVWLTPGLKPFFAGTYFPPEDGVRGMRGFRPLCQELGRVWCEDRAHVEQVAERNAEVLQQALSGGAPPDAAPGPDENLLRGAAHQMVRDFDPVHGGFGGAPKFPPAMRLAFLLRQWQRTQDGRLRKAVEVTLHRMARGGMYDQIGGGFHRYSVDARWLVPHFEKMLYDNALLAWVYLDAGAALSEPAYHRIARQVLEDVLRQFVHPEGGFYSTLDADSEGEEGKFYVWTPEEVTAALGSEDGDLFNRLYDVTPRGNFEEKNIPNLLRRSLPEWARELGLTLPELYTRVDGLRSRLLSVRSQRIAPGLDDKVLTSWNGIMIRAFARAHELWGEERYREAGERAADFVLSRMRRDGRLLRTFRNSQAHLNAYLDDHSFLAVGLLHLHSATGDRRWLDEACGLLETLDRHYADPRGGGYFFTSDDHEALIARAKGFQDDAIPSGNAMAALAWAQLARATGERDCRARAEAILAAGLQGVERYPAAFATLLLAADTLLHDDVGEAVRPGTGTVATPSVDPEGVPPPGPDVRLEVPSTPWRVRPGATVELPVRMRIPSGWHVNSSNPREEYLIPTRLEVEGPRGLEVEAVEYPSGEELELGEGAKPLSVYAGEVNVRVRLQVAGDLEAGQHRVVIRARYQACTDRECRPPAVVSADASITVEP